MLVVGWITVVSGVFSLLSLPVSASMARPAAPYLGADASALLAADALTKLWDVSFWGWALYVLQFRTEVREAFTP